jgi:hypothetical protein
MGEAKTMTRDLILSSSCRTPLLLVTAGFFSLLFVRFWVCA